LISYLINSRFDLSLSSFCGRQSPEANFYKQPVFEANMTYYTMMNGKKSAKKWARVLTKYHSCIHNSKKARKGDGNGNSVLHEVPTEEGNQEPAVHHAEKWQASGGRRVSHLWHESIQNRESLKTGFPPKMSINLV